MTLFLLAQIAILSEWVLPILELVLGLGLVIFIHELGHFMVAKWVDIKVEQFALGFGPKLWGFVRGETEYRLNVLPLGGYVKMVGQEDFKPLDEKQTVDPRSFNSKPIWARFAVVSAGVIMNVILAGILFVIVCMAGIHEIPTVVGRVVPDSGAAEAIITWQGKAPPATRLAAATSGPASAPAMASAGEAIGLMPGDHIVSVDGQPITNFKKMYAISALARLDQVFTMGIVREVSGVKYTGQAQVKVKKTPSETGSSRMSFGISAAADTLVGDVGPGAPFLIGDRVVAINGQPIAHSWEIDEVTKNLDAPAVTVTVDRKGQRVDLTVQARVNQGGPKNDDIITKTGQYIGTIVSVAAGTDGNQAVIRMDDNTEKTVSLKNAIVAPDNWLDILGMTPRLQIISADGKPARSAKLESMDVIVRYGDVPNPSRSQFYRINEQFADKETSIVVNRGGKAVSSTVTPKSGKTGPLIGIATVPDGESTVVAGVRGDSPAAKAKIVSGDVVEKVNGQAVKTWAQVVLALKHAKGDKVTLTIRRNAQTFDAAIGNFGPALFDASQYDMSVLSGLVAFAPMEIIVVKSNPLEAIAWGTNETWEFLTQTISTIRGLATQTVSTDEVVGPVGLSVIAVKIGRQGFIQFVYFLAMISATLAVMNFLPIPVVDGGLAVFLLIEKLRGKPLPLKVTNAIQMAGLGLLLLLMVAITWQDIGRWILNK